MVTARLLESGVITRSRKSSYLSYPFLIPKENGEIRFIVDYAHLTPFIKTPQLHLPLFANVLRQATLPRGLLAVRIDLKSAFYSLLLHPKSRHITNFKVDGKCYAFTRLPMGLATSPHFQQKVLEEALAPIRDQAALSWVHVDDFVILAEPHKIEQLRDTLLDRLQTVGFTVNKNKSQLTPVHAIDYLGLRINLEKRFFTLDRKHLSTFDKISRMDFSRCTGRQERSIRGFLSFVLSSTARQYAFLNAPLARLVALLLGIQRLAGFKIRLRPPRKPPFVYVDATPSQIAVFDTKSGQAMAIPRQGHQAHNELMALLLAIAIYGQKRRYVTDASASLSLSLSRNDLPSLLCLRFCYML